MNITSIGQFVGQFFSTGSGSKAQQTSENVSFQANTQVVSEQTVVNQNSYSINLGNQLAQTTIQLAQLSNTDKTLMLLELFTLPKDIKDFLLFMSNAQNADALSTAELMSTLLNSNIDLSQIAAFIQQNGKQALTKLFQMIASYNEIGASMKSSELNELAAVINACVSSAGNNNAQALKNVMLLYLPWLPLGENVGFNLEIGANPEQGGKESEDTIVIMISTENYGQVQVYLFKTSDESISMQIFCSKEFPKEEVEKAIREDAKSSNIKTNLAFEERENFSKEAEKGKTNVSMSTTPNVNPFLVLMAHLVIKAVLLIDKKGAILEARKEIIEK